MDAKLINPFIDAFHTIMPQIGFTEVKRGNISLKDKTATSKGVTVLVGLTKELGGNVAYNMSEETAKFVASTMMMGMPVESMDDMAQSAISELANMLTANSATNLSQMGIEVDISTPILTIGDGFTLKISNDKYICIEMLINSQTVEINVSIS
ncbi:MAG: chemotaxis protein CheX [Negativicutes bacterium]|nr:chemotaxis protein CheX [Negativicutes bacterium]MBP9537291.1 chemotaxis protein CheX [Negativicutes bacterium]MBP9949675.1 chemotaxis protein CheX [Negativicutes bacterium]